MSKITKFKPIFDISSYNLVDVFSNPAYWGEAKIIVSSSVSLTNLSLPSTILLILEKC